MSIDARDFLGQAQALGVGFVTGVPCSLLGGLFDAASTCSVPRYVAAANEGEAVAIAAGAQLAGTTTCVLMQNSGLGNAVNPLSSLLQVAQIPALLIIGWRGDPAGALDEPQHRLMGRITPTLLTELGIAHQRLATDHATAMDQLVHAMRVVQGERKSVALLVPRGAFAAPAARPESASAQPRRAYLRALLDHARPTDVMVATTGHTARELESLADRPNHFYVVGAMGCASSVALGVALAKPRCRVVMLDGDGAVRMRLSACAVIGAERPANLVHVVFDNRAYASTGGQAVAAPELEVAKVAQACGYRQARDVSSVEAFVAALAGADVGPTMLVVPVPLQPVASLSRPALEPAAVADRFRGHLSEVFS